MRMVRLPEQPTINATKGLLRYREEFFFHASPSSSSEDFKKKYLVKKKKKKEGAGEVGVVVFFSLEFVHEI